MRILRSLSVAVIMIFAGSTAALSDCKCLNRGVEVPEGKTACIKTAAGPKLALCEKNLNVTNWKFLDEACPTAMREERLASQQHMAAAN